MLSVMWQQAHQDMIVFIILLDHKYQNKKIHFVVFRFSLGRISFYSYYLKLL